MESDLEQLCCLIGLFNPNIQHLAHLSAENRRRLTAATQRQHQPPEVATGLAQPPTGMSSAIHQSSDSPIPIITIIPLLELRKISEMPDSSALKNARPERAQHDSSTVFVTRGRPVWCYHYCPIGFSAQGVSDAGSVPKQDY